MKRIVLILLIIAIESSLVFQAYCQNVSNWEMVDSTNIYQGYAYTASGYGCVSGFNDKFVRIGMLSPWFYHNLNLYPVVQNFSMESGKMEIILEDSINESLQFWGVNQVDDNLIIVGGDSIFFQGKFFKDGSEKDFYFYTGMIFISKDNGKTWSKKLLDSNYLVSQISMCDRLHGYALGRHYFNYFNTPTNSLKYNLLYTNDCWETIKIIDLPENQLNKYINFLRCYSKDSVAFGSTFNSNNFYLSYTFDGGMNWEYRRNNDFKNMIISNMDFININLGYAFVSKKLFADIPRTNFFIRTIDGGKSWENYGEINRINSPEWSNIRSIDFFDSLNGIAGSNNSDKGIVLRTTDGGLSWDEEILPFNTLRTNLEIPNVFYSKKVAVAALTEIFTYANFNKQILKTPQFHDIINEKALTLDKVNLKWESIKGAQRYRLKMDTTENPLSGFINDFSLNFKNALIDTILTDTVFYLKNTDYDVNYRCNVQALNEKETSHWSTQYNLHTLVNDSAVSSPEVVYPIYGQNISENSVTIKWTSLIKADKYNLKIYNAETNEQYFNDYVYDTLFYIPDLQPNSIYLFEITTLIGNIRSIYPTKSYFYTYDVLHIEENIKKDFLFGFIYPNPTTEYIEIQTVETGLISVSTEFIEIYNVFGENVKILNIFTSSQSLPSIPETKNTNSHFRVDVSDLPSGVYFARVGEFVGRFVKY